ncbi:MAG: hypothetical protein PHF74_07625 [Dehalococcoidales bacterium]|nr:hypothetical protein [Dehalococcoidales bacterium]
MNNDSVSKSFHLPGAICLLFWIVLLLLTSAILLFPVNLEFEYHAVESLYIFGDNLWLFGIIFVLWMAVLLLLLLGRISEWQRVVLVGIFAVVVFGFWVIAAPYGGYADGLVNMGHVQYLSQTGSISFDHINLAYFQYPGLHLTGFALSEISGLEIMEIRSFFLIFCRVLLAILLYLLFARSIKNPQMASLAVLVLVSGAMLITRTMFHAGITAIIFLVILLYFLVKGGVLAKPAIISLFIICFIALTISYVPIPIFFIFILGGIYITSMINKQKTVNLALLILCAVIFIIWQMFWATRMFEGLTGHIEDFLAAFNNPLERLFPMFSTASQSLGEATPLWASLTRYFWLLAVYLFGVILAMINLFRIKKLDSIEVIETGGLWGVLIASAVAIFAFEEGTQWGRTLMYVPFLAVPIIIKFISASRRDKIYMQLTNTVLTERKANNFSLVLVPLVLLILSFPTFLVNHSDINTQSVYEYELSAGEYLEEYYDDESLLLVSDVITDYTYVYFIPEAELSAPPHLWAIADEEDLWLSFQKQIEKFESFPKTAVFAITERYSQPYRSRYPLNESDPRWIEFIDKLLPYDMIYNDGHTRIYLNQP